MITQNLFNNALQYKVLRCIGHLFEDTMYVRYAWKVEKRRRNVPSSPEPAAIMIYAEH